MASNASASAVSTPADLDIFAKLTQGKNPRGIPSAIFVEDVDAFVATLGDVPVETILGAYQELLSKYKYMESSIKTQKANYKSKLPEIEKTLDLVRHLQTQQLSGTSMDTTYCIADNLYARAEVQPSGTVCLWLGANVMLEYSYDEAVSLLEVNRSAALSKLEQAEEDLAHLKGQSVTVEVAINRLINYTVQKRKEEAIRAAQAQIQQIQQETAGGAGGGVPAVKSS